MKLDGGRVDAEDVINELMEDIQIENMAVQEDSGGLQLYLGPDGSVRFDQPSTLDTDFQPVVINDR